jgi:short-subunit dehydrogenase
MRLEGKEIVLTGGAGGIGAILACELMHAGAAVTVIDRVGQLPFEAPYIRGDLATMDGLDKIAKTIADLSPDILVNLAGVQYFGPFENQTRAHLHMSYMVNLVAPVLLTHALMPGMKRRGAGQIVNIGSIFGSINYAHFVTYSSAKAGLHGFSEALRRELNGTNIGVTYIAPRAVKTGLNSTAVMRFSELTKMHMDEPDAVARRIVRAIEDQEKDVYIGLSEGFFVRLNALMPRLIDAVLAADNAKARSLFPT